MERQNKKLYEFIINLECVTYVLIKLRYGAYYIAIAKGQPQEILNTMPLSLYDLRNFSYEYYFTQGNYEVHIYLEDIIGD